MTKARLFRGALPLLLLALASCGADPTAPGAASRAAALGGAETSAVVSLECSRFHIEVTRSTGVSEDRDEAEDLCGDALRRARPTVRCPGCSIPGACKPLTRRSDIVYNCVSKDGTWTCGCAQRAVLGCYPCTRTSAAPQSGACEAGTDWPAETAALDAPL